jgi:cation-transporting ATPase 13A3/4/5
VVIKRFEFTPELQRQVVIAKSLETGELAVMAKGAPEIIRTLCHPATIPSDFDLILSSYATQGMRVLGLAGKPLPEEAFSQDVRREMVERDLEFRGMLVLSNPLKPNTATTIAVLKRANIKSVMATGDNLQTAVSVAKSCGIIGPSDNVYYGEIHRGSLLWTPALSSLPPLDPLTLKPAVKSLDYALAVHGNAFENVAKMNNPVLFRAMLEKAAVFGRMKPDHKRQLIEAYEDVLDVYTGMCGDGANDAGALKAARVGLSLSQTEASVAAPFTSAVPDIASVVELIKQGRCALSTSFSLFRFMSLYSLINFACIIALYLTWTWMPVSWDHSTSAYLIGPAIDFSDW